MSRGASAAVPSPGSLETGKGLEVSEGTVGRVTLQTVADQVGVSRMTVSNAFSRPDQLSAALRDKILAAADKLGYAGPDPSARALARGTSGMVGLILTESPGDAFRDDVSVAFLGAVAEGFSRTGLSLILVNPGGADGIVPMRDTAMDGAIVYSCAPRTDSQDWLHRRAIPTVTVDQDPRVGSSSVNVDDYHGARAAAEHLIDLGHTRVALVEIKSLTPGDPRSMDNIVTRERRRGFLDGLGECREHVRIIGANYAGADSYDREQLQALLGGKDRPTGVLCYSDVIAADVLAVAAQLGLQVPRDLSVVGYDDNPLATRVYPNLTTVRQNMHDKGHAAADALIAAMDAARQGHKARTRRIVIPTELVVRDSSGPPPRLSR